MNKEKRGIPLVLLIFILLIIIGLIIFAIMSIGKSNTEKGQDSQNEIAFVQYVQKEAIAI